MTPDAILAALAGGVAAFGATDVAHAWRRPVAPRRLVHALLARAGRNLAHRAPRGLDHRLELADVDADPGDVMAVKTGAALLTLLATLPLTPDPPARFGPLLTALAAAAAFLAPDVWLRALARARRRAIEAELADVLDLLRVATAAGLPPSRALAEVGRRHPGALGRELHRAAQATALGVPTVEALAILRRRCATAGVTQLVATLERAARHGSPLGPALEAQAAEARSRAARGHTERAARAAPQIQLVVALLLVPSVLLLVAAALVPA